ncbi:MAG: DUF1476 domain-containing protein [Gemmatimonas sp.]
MTTFDKREDAFEKQFVHDEELKFKAEARRNRLLGLWVAEKLGKTGSEAEAYAKEVVAAEIDAAGEKGVVKKILGDLAAKNVAIGDAEISAKMNELMVAAIAQVKAGV